MLILTRKTGQGFTIGGDIEITITEISGDKVRVGINAPREIKILRSELSETVESNQRAAAGPGADSLRGLVQGLKAAGGLAGRPAAQDAAEPAPRDGAREGEKEGE